MSNDLQSQYKNLILFRLLYLRIFWLSYNLFIYFFFVFLYFYAQVHEQEFGSESASGWVNGTFYMDPSLGRDTVMAVYFYSRDFNTHVGDIRLVSPDGVEHRGISETAMASLYVTPLEPIEKVIFWNNNNKNFDFCFQLLLVMNNNFNVFISFLFFV